MFLTARGLMAQGLHLDQNPVGKPGRHAVQGMVPLYPADEIHGGLEVVPRSHRDDAKEAWKARYPDGESLGDWCELDEADPSCA